MTAGLVGRANAEVDERVGSQKFLRDALDHIFPDNWTFMLGEIAFYCFLLLVLTGVYLTFFFDPSDAEVVYHGSYLPLHGQSMSLAYQSTVHLSLDVRAGLFFRQIHHWAADVFVAAIVCHLARIFFTGAFRKPRDINWLVGVTLLLASIFNGFTGYSLPGDLMSGLGLRIGYSIAESVPVIGSWLAYLFFGGQFPSPDLTHRLFVLHVFVVPVLILGLLGVHLALIWRQKHTQFAGTGRSEKRIVGSQLWPTYTFRSIGLLAAVAAVLCLLGGLAQINPIWLYGPYHPYDASSLAQPDWYTGWMEGALRLMLPFRLDIFGFQISEVFWPAVVLPLLTFAALYAWPFLERWWTGDLLAHNVLDRPRDRPARTAIGVAALTFYIVLTVAGAQDAIAAWLEVSQPPVTLALRGLAVLLPVVTGALTYRVCRQLGTWGLPETEPPLGSARSATPRLVPYLPERAAWERLSARDGVDHDGRGQDDGTRRLKVLATGAGLLAAFVAGRVTRRSQATNGTRRLHR